MKFSSLFLSSTSLALLFTGVAEAAPRFDYQKINKHLAEAVQSVLTTQSAIGDLNFQINSEGIDVEQDAYQVDFTLGMAQTAWSKDAMDAEGSFSIDVEKGEKGEKGSIDLEAKITMKTDALAFFKHMLGKKADMCQHLNQQTGLNRLILADECAMIGTARNAESIQELFELFKAHKQAHIVTFENFISEGRASLAGITSASLREEAERSLQRAEKLLQAARKAVIAETKDGFMLDADDIDLGIASAFGGMKELAAVDDVKAVMSEGEITLQIEFELFFGQKAYKHAKPEIIRLMKSLEHGEEYAKETAKARTRFFLSCLSEAFGRQ